jgi:hypothetical protein
MRTANLSPVTTAATLTQARAAKAEVAKRLSGHPLVNGIGIARVNGGYAGKVNLSAPVRNGMPRTVAGVPVKTEVVGRISRRAVPA